MPGKTSEMRLPGPEIDFNANSQLREKYISVTRGKDFRDVEVIVKLDPTVLITGRVFEGDNKTPITNTMLRLEYAHGSVATVCTDEKGRYEFKYRKSPGKIRLTFIKGNFKATRKIQTEPGAHIENVDFVLSESR